VLPFGKEFIGYSITLNNICKTKSYNVKICNRVYFTRRNKKVKANKPVKKKKIKFFYVLQKSSQNGAYCVLFEFNTSYVVKRGKTAEIKEKTRSDGLLLPPIVF